MTTGEAKNIFDSSMLDLFRMEVEQHATTLINELPKLSLDPMPEEQIEPLVRAAHSIKGAGRLVGVTDVVGIAQQMEECLSAVRRGLMALNEDLIGLLIRSVEMVSLLSEKTKETQ
jgi:two-component system sensor histidine kinase and response regulator WspE